MVKAVNFAVRSAAGVVFHGEVAGTDGSHFLQVGSGEQISLNLAQAQVSGYARQDGNLVVTLIDGREIVVAGFFDAPPGSENKLFLSANGDIAEAHLTDGGNGTLFASYGVNEGWGKFSALDDLRFEGGDVLAAAGATDDTTGMSPFVPGLFGFGGKSLLATGLITAIVGGGGGGGGDSNHRATPTVDDPNSSNTLTTNTTDPHMTITGTGEPGDTVRVTVGNAWAITTIGTDGHWTATIPQPNLPPDGTYESVVVVTPPTTANIPPITLDGPGYIIDMTPPPVAVTEGSEAVGHIENAVDHGNGVTLAGTGEPGATIKVEVAGATQTTTVSAQGTWTVTFTTTQVVAGEYTVPVTVTATDPLGNKTVITEHLVVDTVPNALVIDPVTADNLVNAAEQSGGFAITGTTAPGATVTVVIGTLTQTATAGSDGHWTTQIAANALTPGEYDATITARTVDAAGNPSSTTHTMRVDTIGAVTINGPVATDDIVNAAESASGVQLTGTAQAGSIVNVAWNGTTLPATVGANGSWSVTFPGTALPSGEQNTTISVTATDAAGNTSSTTRPVRIDTTTSVTIDPSQVGGDNIISGTEQQAGAALTGHAEAGASVAVTMEGVTRTVTAGTDGTWTATFARSEIPQGTYNTTVTVRSTDLAGNTASATHQLAVDTEVKNFAKVGDSTGADHVLNGTEATSGLTVNGTVEPGSTVMIRFGSGQTHAALVGADGNWSVTVPPSEVPPGESNVNLTMTATDRVGNIATLSEQINVDTLVRNFARTGSIIGSDGVLNAVEVGHGLPLTGTVEPGATVVVRLSNGIEKSVVAGSSGLWSVNFDAADLPRGEQNVTASLTATDRAGNTASLSDSFRVDTVAPGSPEVASFSRDANGLRAIGTEITEDSYTFTRVESSGGQTTISATRTDDTLFHETNFRFSSTVPDGSYLVVNTADTAGNQSSTLLIVDNTNATTVNLDRPGLASFDFTAIDLTFAPDAKMAINEQQLNALTGPDHRLIVKGGNDDTVTLTGGTLTGQSTVIDGERYNIFTLGSSGATVLLDDDIRAVV